MKVRLLMSYFYTMYTPGSFGFGNASMTADTGTDGLLTEAQIREFEGEMRTRNGWVSCCVQSVTRLADEQA